MPNPAQNPGISASASGDTGGLRLFVFALFFIFGGMVYPKEMGVLLVSSTVGGYLVGHYGRRLDPAKARVMISCLNATITAIVFWRAYR